MDVPEASFHFSLLSSNNNVDRV